MGEVGDLGGGAVLCIVPSTTKGEVEVRTVLNSIRIYAHWVEKVIHTGWCAYVYTPPVILSSRACRWRHDALDKEARRLKSITLHGSASARHSICTIG